MCKYEMDPASIVKDTELTLFCPQMDRRTGGKTDKVKPVYPPLTLLNGGYNKPYDIPREFISLYQNEVYESCLTHWGRVTHICVGKLTIIGSDNGLSPGRRQTIIWTNAGIMLIRPIGTNFSEILIGIQTFSFKKMYLKMSSAKWRPFCLGFNVLTRHAITGL